MFPDRSLDIDVVFDLMIHDLDIILALVTSEVDVDRGGRRAGADAEYDIANARLRFASGCIANMTASRISRDRVRKIRFFQPDAYLSIDYAAQEVEGWRLVRRDGSEPAIQGGQAAGRARGAAASASSRTSSRPCATAPRRWSTARPAAARWSWRRRSRTRWRVSASESVTEPSITTVHVFNDLNDFHRRPRQGARAGADRRAGQPRSRDLRRHRSRVASRRAAVRRCCSSGPPASTCRWPSTCSARWSGCAWRSA